MSRARQLYELQEVDLEIEAKREALARLGGMLGESQAVAEARSDLARDQQRLAELEKGQRVGEWDVEDLRSKAALLEEKLYGGSVRNPRELIGLQEQLEQLRRKRREQEDRVLDIMMELEATQSGVVTKTKQLEEIEQRWRQEQSSLLREQAELNASLANLGQRRIDLAARIDGQSLELYQHLREKRQGRVVAKVEQGMCQGCRIVLPMNELQQARMGQELVQCSSCQRILFLS